MRAVWVPIGSPPRVRGKDTHFFALLALNGITPACAGKSPASGPVWRKRGDHPRVCGEKHGAPTSEMRAAGSPPRVRGKGLAGLELGRLEGITPACAGKSWKIPKTARMTGDHPRVCGEKAAALGLAAAGLGSPPRVRGKASLSASAYNKVRITPACAGKSLSKLRRRAGLRDHPRVCGEKINMVLESSLILGSPPRVRGKAVFVCPAPH